MARSPLTRASRSRLVRTARSCPVRAFRSPLVRVWIAPALLVLILGTALAACESPGADGVDDRGLGTNEGPEVSEPAPPLVVRGGTLVDGTGGEPVSEAVVVARAGSIRAAGPAEEVPVPEDARVIDAGGRFVVPGYVDAHVHYSQTGWFDGRPDAADLRERYPYPRVAARLRDRPERFFRAYFCAGVTATFDVGGYPWTRSLEARGARDPDAPRVEAAGPLLSTVDFWLNLPDQKQFVYMAGETAVREAVRSHAFQGSSAIKVWFITPPEPPDSSRAVRLVRVAGEEAEQFGLPFVVHATGLWEAKEAVRAGADVLVHSVFDRPVDEEFLTLAREEDVVYTPTLAVREGYRNAYRSGGAGRFPYPTACVDSTTLARVGEPLPASEVPGWAKASPDTPPEELPPVPGLETGIENLRRVHEAGVTVAMGTDAGNPGTLHGPSVYREMELLARGGLTPGEVLIASTHGAARAQAARAASPSIRR